MRQLTGSHVRQTWKLRDWLGCLRGQKFAGDIAIYEVDGGISGIVVAL